MESGKDEECEPSALKSCSVKRCVILVLPEARLRLRVLFLGLKKFMLGIVTWSQFSYHILCMVR